MKHIIIGAGAAGIAAAKTIRKLDRDADITLISEDTSVHSRCMLGQYLSHERNEETLNFVPDDFFLSNRITWISGEPVGQIYPDSHRIALRSGEQLHYDKLLIATGAESVIPPIGELRIAKNVFGLRNLSDAQSIVKNVATGANVIVIGSGLVGMDAAYGLLQNRINVTVLEMADHILPLQLDNTAAEAYQRLFEEHGCKFVLGEKATNTETDSNGEIHSILLENGTKLPCDAVIVAVGVKANTAYLPADILSERGSVNVDNRMQTVLPDIYAAGDVTGLSGIWPNAVKQGRVAACAMLGKDEAYTDTYALKNTMNFYGLPTLSLGMYCEVGDETLVRESMSVYERIVLKDGRIQSILLQGNIDYSGIWQYLIKNKIDIAPYRSKLFRLSYADFFATERNGQYCYR